MIKKIAESPDEGQPFVINTKDISANNNEILGQALPCSNLARLLLTAELSPKKTLAVLGPPGVGKTSSVQLVAKMLGIHLCHCDLATFGSSVIQQIAKDLLPNLHHRTAVLFTGLGSASTEQNGEADNLINSRTFIDCVYKRKETRIDFEEFIWIVEHIDSTSPLPGLITKIPESRRVTFNELSASDLFAIVGRHQLGSIEAWMKNRGVNAEFSELAILEIVHQSLQCSPYSGIRSVEHLLRKVAVATVLNTLGEA